MTAKEWLEKAIKANGTAKTLRDKIAGEKRAATPEEEKQIDAMLDEGEAAMKEHDALTATDIAVKGRQERLDRLAASIGKPHRADSPHADLTVDEKGVPIPAEKEPASLVALKHKAFRIYAKGGWSEVAAAGPEYVKALGSLRDGDGGFITSIDQRSELITKTRDLVQMRQMCTVLQTSKASVTFPSFDYDGSAPQAQELETLAEEDVSGAFGRLTFTPHKRGRIVVLPNELIDDADFDIEAFINTHNATRYAELDETDFIAGTGVMSPLGIVPAMALAPSRMIDSGGATNVLVPEDVYDSQYHIKKQYRQKGGMGFLMNRTTIKKARKLRDGSGGAGTGQFMWEPSLKEGEPDRLAGSPVMETEFLADPAADGDCHWIYGNWKMGYYIVDRMPITRQRLIEKYAEKDAVGVLTKWRVDGGPVLADCFVRLNRN